MGQPNGLAIDPSGNVWVYSQYDKNIVEFIGGAAATRTPIIAAISQGFAP